MNTAIRFANVVCARCWSVVQQNLLKIAYDVYDVQLVEQKRSLTKKT